MHKFHKKVDYQFLIRAFNNSLSPEEKEYFDEWLSESEKNREDFGAISLLWDKIESAHCPEVPDPSTQWNNITSRVNSVQQQTNNRISEKNKVDPQANIYELSGSQTVYFKAFLNSRLFQAAAILLLMLTASVFYFKDYLLPKKNIPKAVQVAASKIIEVKTRNGERLSLTLSDGSKVYLNNSSKLTFPEFFEDSKREVELEGEAYFSVTPNKNRPFSVKTGNTITVVRGTEFNIRNRGELISFVVVKGSVDTYDPKSEKKYNLKKGDLLSYNIKTGFSQPRKANVQHYLAWRKDKFSFAKTPLKEVMEEIERYYNLNVIFKADSLEKKTITGFFSSDSIKKILSIISLTLDIKIKYNGRDIVVDRN